MTKIKNVEIIVGDGYMDYWYPKEKLDGIMIVWSTFKQPDNTYACRFYFHKN